MTRDEVLSILREHADELRAKGVTRLQLFGSVARGDETVRSDVDLLADFRPHLGIIKIGSIQYRLEKLLNTRVDLTSPEWLRSTVSETALQDAVDVF